MKRVALVVAAGLVAGLTFAQEGARYIPSDNPFQGDFPFGPGRPVELYVDVEGVRLDAVTVSALEDVRPNQPVRCEVQITGNSIAKKKATLAPVVLLLEDASGKGIERIMLDSFKVRSGRPFDEKQRLDVGGDALTSAMKVYVLVQVGF